MGRVILNGPQNRVRETAMARGMSAAIADKHTTFYISRFAPYWLLDAGVRFSSYNAPVGRFASLRPGEYIDVPGGSLEVVERTLFHAEALPDGWDSRDTIFEAEGQKTFTIASLLRLLSEREDRKSTRLNSSH